MNHKAYSTGTVRCSKNRPRPLAQKQKSVTPNLPSRMILAVQCSNFQDGADMYEQTCGFRIKLIYKEAEDIKSNWNTDI